MSNLIEQFGGYEKCKEIVNQPLVDFAMNAQALREAMLEYRREHGIFEVGDKVVGGSMNYIFTVVHLYDDGDGDEDVALVCGSNSYETHLTTRTIRHATPEEIAAGHRL